MHRYSRGYNNSNGTRNRSNLSESTSTTSSVIFWNVFKAFFSLLSSFHYRRVLRKVNPINCLLSAQRSISGSALSFSSTSTINHTTTTTTPSSSDSSKSSSINNCNISCYNNISQPKLKKMAQILSKTVTLIFVGFLLIHFIIMSTFAEREGYVHGYDSEGSRHVHRSQRSYRNEKNILPSEENTLAPTRVHNKSEALFFTENSTVITAQIQSETYLPCSVRNMGSGVASWIRRRDYTLLTVGMGTYNTDLRFWVVHNRAAQSWELHIKPVKETDEGIYECQISSHPASSIFIHLSVVEAKAEILGEPDKHVRSGSTFELVCVLRDSTEPPVYVFWFHNEKMINYDVVRGVVVNSDSEKSILTIHDAKKTDSGSYRCVPSNAKPTSISVHILNGEKPAAMQHGSRNGHGRPLGSSLGLLFVTAAVFVVTAWLLTTNLNQNLCYLHRELDIAPPSSEELVYGNQQLVHIPQPQEESIQPTWTMIRKRTTGFGLRGIVYEAESACADKVDMRLDAALREEKFRLILSASRVYILEISYPLNHDHNNIRVSWKTHAFLVNSTSNKKAKNVADVAVLSHVVVSKENRSNNIINSVSPSHHPFPTRLISTTSSHTKNLQLQTFSPSFSPSSLVPFTSFHVKPEPTTSSKLSFDKESLLNSPESERTMSGMSLISSR